jgi:methylenetetrahydrofolate dehydrogenase (NADP+)/methenyltetrahydrofolate cyclohydrolase
MTSGRLLKGSDVAGALKRDLAPRLARLTRAPQLRVLYFENPASRLYWQAQRKLADELGIGTDQSVACPQQATQAELERIIQQWNADPAVHGIFVHQPMPPGIDPQRISAVIDPRKDVEGIHPQNSARRFFARARIGSCTALAVLELIESTGADLAGKEAVVVGHSEIVGRPVSMLLLDKLATTTICHAATKNLEDHVRRADILVVAVGKPHLIKGPWIKAGAIVIDVGINVVDGKVVGDVEFDAARARAGWITPVPGGVGPVTVMMVMKNTVTACEQQEQR